MGHDTPGQNADRNTSLPKANVKDMTNEKIKVGTLNVQNIRGNAMFIQDTMKDIHILMIQEHWLFTFEQNEISTVIPDIDFYARSVDEDSPINQAERIRGYGGVAFLWKNIISPYIKPLSDGTTNVIALEVEASPKPLCLINAYMPCRGRKNTAQLYRESLDVIREITLKYQPTHTIVIGGDLNASLHRDPPNILDNNLKNFVTEMEIILPENYPTEPTFYHHDNKSSSQIDYFFCLKDQKHLGIDDIRIHGHQNLNTSDHVLVTGEITINKLQKQKVENTAIQQIHCKPKWGKCNDTQYQETIEQLLNADNMDENNNNFQLELDIIHLTNVLHTATSNAIPNHKSNGNRIIKGRKPWNKDIGEASRTAKQAFFQWKQKGANKSNQNKDYLEMKSTKKILRQKQRQAIASIRENKYNTIMESYEFNQPLFYKIIREQRITKQNCTDTIILDDMVLTEEESILNGWNIHFQRLSTPSDEDGVTNFSDMECSMIEQIIKDPKLRKKIPEVSANQVEEAIQNLANGKAPDHTGLTAEHLKRGGNLVTNYLTRLVNTALSETNIPEILKTGILTPVLKKEKDPKMPGNYRGISVTPIIGKIIETILKQHIEPTITKIQNPLQRGFTEKTSPINAAIMVSEGINEAKDRHIPVAITTLDAEKAFDKLVHNHLFRKLYHYNITDDSWLIMRMLQTEANTRVKWNGKLSEGFTSRQGIRQGAKLSPTLYKCYNNQLLDLLTYEGVGARIGTTFIGCPTVADDIAIITYNPEDLQQALHIVNNETSKDGVKINSSKSDVIIINDKKDGNSQTWALGNQQIAEVSSTKHIGLVRSVDCKNDIQERIEKGRRTLYALLGAGLHGKNGINPIVSHKVYITFCRPRIIYGLEAVKLSSKEKDELSRFERRILKQLQGLPERCSNTITYALIAATPIITQIEKNTLTSFYNIIRNKDTSEYQIAKRQLILKDINSNSWFTQIRILLQKYNLPDAFELMERTPSKGKWKTMLNEAVQKHLKAEWSEDLQEKSTTSYFNMPLNPINNAHQVWSSVPNNTRSIRKANIKARLLTGTYTLQTNRAKYNQHAVSPTCPSCKTGDEDRQHLILHCSTHKRARDKHLSTLKLLLTTKRSSSTADSLFVNSELLMQCLMDSSDYRVTAIIGEHKDIVCDIEEISRNLIYDIHTVRAVNESRVTRL